MKDKPVYTVKRYNARRYGDALYASFVVFMDGVEIGHTERYVCDVRHILKMLNSGSWTLERSGFKALNGEFFSLCSLCGNVHIDGTKGNCGN